MITEMYVKHFAGKMRVVVYPEKHSIEARVYDDPTQASCVRLERVMNQFNAQPYIKPRGISVWIAR